MSKAYVISLYMNKVQIYDFTLNIKQREYRGVWVLENKILICCVKSLVTNCFPQ